uniref:PUL domain-containing protein n=1 Tax=Fagus sylvatica TaxID=28930 RepID=A0A2N9ECM6_FAGSY
MEGELDKKACQNSLISFGLHSSPFIAKREEPTWASVSFLMEEDNGEEPKLVPMQIVLKREGMLWAWDVTFNRNFNDWEVDLVMDFLDFLHFHVPFREEDDGWRWRRKRIGDFDTKSFNTALRGNMVVKSFPWQSIWGSKAPRRVVFFLWTTTWGKILTNDNLMRRGHVMAEWCCMCRGTGETIDHLMLHCPLTSDTVRGLAVMSDLGILSASHDGSIRLWAISGEVLMEMVGHTSIVYSADSHISGLIVSASEDCSAKIWKDGVCVQTIEHPGCVWDAKFLDNGDIVTACSDGVIRIWTVHQDRMADSLELESYTAQLSQYKRSRKRVGGLKLEDLPGLDALQVPGTSDGQTKVVREGDNGVAYAWNLREQKWDKIGEVVDGPDNNLRRPVLDGSEYDYDNPYATADKWLLKENLPLSYRQQIVEFILQNSGQKDFNLDSSFRDPYTGSSAYIPGQTSNMSAGSAKPTFKHIPKKGVLVFDVAQFDGILKKITEFNNALLSDLEKKDLSLTELELSRVGAIVKVLKDTSHYHSSKLADVDIALLLKLLNSWPLAMIFPVIDILRMTVLHPDGATVLLKHVEAENDALMEIIKKVTTNPAIPANLLTSIRAVTNLFKNSCYYNCYAVLLIEKKDQEGQSQVLSAALEIAEEENLEVDSKFRALVAIGSLMLEGLVRKIALDLEVEDIAKAAKASKEAKIAEVGVDIELLTK